jgi:predicted CXXCH cytochrome family protein
VAYRGSDHDHAMQPPTEATVLGNFEDVNLEYAGERVVFSNSDGRFAVTLPDAEGKRRSFDIRYVFGVKPLQQYLADVGRGRLQALPFAWDTRPQDEGGQRWFHVYGDEVVGHDDALHWTSPNHNWNHACADCHSTNVDKGFDAATGAFETTYSDVNVGCEACHGPGSVHLSRAKAGQLATGLGFTKYSTPRSERSWSLEGDARIAHLDEGPSGAADHEVCAACHSLRSDLGRAPGATDFHDRYRLQLIQPPLYFDDGQIKEEVYVYGSFLQSKMAHAGVTCTDCHDAHSGRTHAQGNALCAQCHNTEVFGARSHHFHPPGPGTQCTGCHMPERTYMQIDARRDHRFGIPRPDESERLGTPLACLDCHAGKTNAWARAAIEANRRASPKRAAIPARKWPAVLRAARGHSPRALADLRELVQQPDLPDIIRATGIELLGVERVSDAVPLLQRLTQHDSPLVRRAVVQATTALSPHERGLVLEPLLSDESRSVRLEAVGRLLGDPRDVWSPKTQRRFDEAVVEFRASHRQNSDRAESLVALANLEMRGGNAASAKALLENAIARDPTNVIAHVNLADLQRRAGDEAIVQQTLNKALAVVADPAPVHHALGLSLVRAKQRGKALRQLEAAHRAKPDDRQYGFVYAVALSETDLEQALGVLNELLELYPEDPMLLRTAAEYEKRKRSARRPSP